MSATDNVDEWDTEQDLASELFLGGDLYKAKKIEQALGLDPESEKNNTFWLDWAGHLPESLFTPRVINDNGYQVANPVLGHKAEFIKVAMPELEELYDSHIDYDLDVLKTIFSEALSLMLANKKTTALSDVAREGYFTSRSDQINNETYILDKYEFRNAITVCRRLEVLNKLCPPMVVCCYFAHRLFIELLDADDEEAYEALKVLVIAEYLCSATSFILDGSYAESFGAFPFFGGDTWGKQTEIIHRNAPFYAIFTTEPRELLSEDFDTAWRLFEENKYQFFPFILLLAKLLPPFASMKGGVSDGFKVGNNLRSTREYGYNSGGTVENQAFNQFFTMLMDEFPDLRTYLALERPQTESFYHDACSVVSGVFGGEDESESDIRRNLLDIFANC